MIPLMSWLPLTFEPPCLANASSSPVRVIASEPTLLTTSVGLKPSLREVSLSSAVNAGMENETTTWAPDARSGDLRSDVDVGRIVGLLADHHRGRELVAQALDPVLAELVVLGEEADLLAREVLLHVLAEDLPLPDVVQLPAERLRVRRRVVPALAPGRDEHVGDLLRVQEAHRGQVRGRAEAVEHGVHAVLQHQ